MSKKKLSDILLKKIDTFLNPKFENKYIYLLLTLGTCLLGGTLVMAYRASIQLENGNTLIVEVGNSESYLTMILGIIIILISSFLFYKNNLSERIPHKVENKRAIEKRKRDVDSLYYFMCQISTIEMDEFIYRGKLSQIHMRGLHYVEGVLGVISDSSFHIYDENLRKQIEEFGEYFDMATSFGEFFRPVAHDRLQRFAKEHEYSDYDRLKEAEKSYLNTIHSLETSYRNLIKTVKNEYFEIEINETNRLAVEDYAYYENKMK